MLSVLIVVGSVRLRRALRMLCWRTRTRWFVSLILVLVAGSRKAERLYARHAPIVQIEFICAYEDHDCNDQERPKPTKPKHDSRKVAINFHAGVSFRFLSSPARLALVWLIVCSHSKMSWVLLDEGLSLYNDEPQPHSVNSLNDCPYSTVMESRQSQSRLQSIVGTRRGLCCAKW
jgi:hypothetical protein